MWGYKAPHEQLWGRVSDKFEKVRLEAEEGGCSPEEARDAAGSSAIESILDGASDAPLFLAIDALDEAAIKLTEAMADRDMEVQRLAATGADTRHLEALKEVVEEQTENLREAVNRITELGGAGRSIGEVLLG